MERYLQLVTSLQRKLQNKPKLIGYILFSVGFFLLAFGVDNYRRARILSFSSVPEEAKASVQEKDPPIKLTIPSIEIDLPIEPGQIKDGVWQISASNATFLNTSAAPGQGGNTVIYGHNKKVIFGNLAYLSVGQKVVLKTQSGKTYSYEVYKKEFVKPDRVDLVSPTDYEELTLYTCWGVFDSQRVVVKAKPVSS